MWTSLAVVLALYTTVLVRTTTTTTKIDALAATCPDGFEGHQGSCYFFSHGKATWLEAYESCTELFGGNLAEITTDAENLYVSQKTVSLGGSTYWIGLTDEFVEGSFFWMSNKQPPVQTYWGSGEPDIDQTENCVRYSKYHQHLWSDASCTDTAYYICELPDGAANVVG